MCPYCQKEITDGVRNAARTVETEQVSGSATPLASPASLPDYLQPLWELPDNELKAAYHSSVVLRRIGMILYILPLLPIALIPLMLFSVFFSSTTMLECVLGCALLPLLFVFYAFFFYPPAYVMRNVRSVKAKKRLLHIAVFSEICGGIVLVIAILYWCHLLFMNGLYGNIHHTEDIASHILLLVLFLLPVAIAHRHLKNRHIFSDIPFSHAELKYVVETRKQPVGGALRLPERYTYGGLAKTAMFLCLFMYLVAIGWNCMTLEKAFTSTGKTSISKEEIQYAEDCVKRGDEAAEAGDFILATDYYEKAAKLGHPAARLALGIIYASGLAGETDCEKAFKLLSDDEIIVSPYAKYFVGFLYYSGQGTKQDFKLAAQYLQTAADAGEKNAQEFLGYEEGKKPDYGMPLEDFLRLGWEEEGKEEHESAHASDNSVGTKHGKKKGKGEPESIH